MANRKIDFGALDWQSPLPGARFKSYEQAGRTLRLLELTEDFVEPEWCTKGHIGYVLEGQMEVDFDGEVVRYSAGDGIFILPGEEHRHLAKVLSEVVRLILVEDA